MRRIYTIRLKGMNAQQAFHDLYARRPGAKDPELMDDTVGAKVKELYFGPKTLSDRGDTRSAMRRSLTQETKTC